MEDLSAMMGARVQYRPASADAWWTAVDDGAVAMLSPSVSAVTAAAVWRRLGDGGIGAVLDALTGAFGTSLAAIPPFALAIAEPGGVRVAVRGAIDVVAEGPDGAEGVSGVGVATWAERLLPGVVRLTVTPASAAIGADAAVPLRSGVALADLVRIDIEPSPVEPSVVEEAPRRADAAAVVPPVPAPLAPAVPDAPLAPAVPDAPLDPEDAEDPVDDDARPASPAVAAEPDVPAVPDVPDVPAAPDAAGPADAPASADTWLPDATQSDVAPADEYDLLWGETVARPVAAAAVATASDALDGAAGTQDVVASPEAPPAAAHASGGDDPAVPPAASGDHDGETISVAEARALRAAERDGYESTDNVPPRRPATGRIVLSTGRVVELERPVVIGRRPKSTRTSASELPTLVAVDSPEQDISRSHVEIRSEGEHVLVTDLDTTNGTVLLRGGHDPVRLHPGEPTMVVTGDVLDIGDGVTVAFEDLP